MLRAEQMQSSLWVMPHSSMPGSSHCLTGSLQWRPDSPWKQAGLHPRSQIWYKLLSGKNTGLSVGAYFPADLLCQNTTVWSKDQKGEREHCTEKVSYCAKTLFSTDDCKRLLKPCLSWLVNPWFGSIQRKHPDFMTKIKTKDLRKGTNIHS